MKLNSKETYDKVIGLFPKLPYKSICYAGCWSSGTVDFEVGVTDQYGNFIAGVRATVTQEFKLVKVQRMGSTWGRYSRKKPLITERIPIHPDGQLVSYRDAKLVAHMGDMRHYEYHKI